METVVQTAAIAAVPLLLGALGVLIASRAGVLFLGAEAVMLIAAFLTAWVTTLVGMGAGLLAALVAGALFSLGLGWIMVVMRADQVVVSIAANILALGMTSYAAGIITADDREALNVGQPSKQAVPLLSDIAVVGPLFDQNWITYVAYILVPVAAYLLFKTGLGTRLRASGEFAEGASAAGINVIRVRILAMGVAGLLGALAGAFMVIGDVGVFQRDISGGRGYIAFVICIIARYHPVGALLGALGFGLAQGFTFYLQLQGIDIPRQFILATPYVVTLLALILLGARAGRPPAEEGRPLRISR
jgi:general nucleoside transport system permease protein